MRRIDYAVGDLKQLLQDLNMDTNTLVVFTSDNGPTTEHYLTSHPVTRPISSTRLARWTAPSATRGKAAFACPLSCVGRAHAGGRHQQCSLGVSGLDAHVHRTGRPAGSRAQRWRIPGADADRIGTQRPSTIYVEYDDPYATPNYPEFEPAHRGRVHNQMQVIRLNGFQGVRYDITSQTDDFEIYDVDSDLKEATNLATNPAFARLATADEGPGAPVAPARCQRAAAL